MNQRFSKRLELLRLSRDEKMAPLWLENERADVIVDNLADNFSPWAMLMKVRALFDLGQNEEAQNVLNDLGDISVGLEGVRDELGVKVSATLLSKSGDETPTDLQLHNWLDQIRRWRQR